MSEFSPDDLLDSHQAARFLGYKTPTLKRWRFKGRGPAWVKDKTNGEVRYIFRVLEEFKANRMVLVGTKDQPLSKQSPEAKRAGK